MFFFKWRMPERSPGTRESTIFHDERGDGAEWRRDLRRRQNEGGCRIRGTKEREGSLEMQQQFLPSLFYRNCLFCSRPLKNFIILLLRVVRHSLSQVFCSSFLHHFRPRVVFFPLVLVVPSFVLKTRSAWSWVSSSSLLLSSLSMTPLILYSFGLHVCCLFSCLLPVIMCLPLSLIVWEWMSQKEEERSLDTISLGCRVLCLFLFM